MTDGEITHALLRQLIAEVRGLRVDMVRRKAQMSPKDEARATQWFPALLSVFDRHEFSVAEAIMHPKLAMVFDGAKRQSIGTLFSKAKGIAIDGLIVEQIGKVHGAWLWRVARVSDFGEAGEALRVSALPMATNSIRRSA